MTRMVALRLRLIVRKLPGKTAMMVVKTFVVVTVTVTTRCFPGQLVVAGLKQSLVVAVLEKSPLSSAHWQYRDAAAVMPVVLVAPLAVLCIVVVPLLFDGLYAPYCAPARAASVSAIAV